MTKSTKRLMYIFTAISAALAICGGALRRIQYLTVIDAETGLAEPWAPISLVLLASCALIIIGSFLMSRAVSRSINVSGRVLQEMFAAPAKAPRLLLPLLSCVAMAFIVVTAFSYYIAVRKGLVPALERFAPDAVMTVFTALAGLAVLTLGLRIANFAGIRGKSSEVKLALAVLTIFPCYHMVLTYLNYVPLPNLLLYSYDMIALGAVALAALYTAGFAFTPETASPKWTLMFLWIATTLNGIAAGNPAQPRFRGIFIFHAAVCFAAALLFTSNSALSPAGDEQIPLAEAEAADEAADEDADEAEDADDDLNEV